MIYTSYFDNLQALPKNIVPISICGKAPEWYKGLQYKKLAPKLSFFNIWKQTHDNNYYINNYNDKVLSTLTQSQVIADLKHLCNKSMYDNIDIALICYEEPNIFCHRHLVAEWLKIGGYECIEF